MTLGPFAGFIWAAYGVSAFVIAGLIAWLIFDGRRQAHALAALEKLGIKRRSE